MKQLHCLSILASLALIAAAPVCRATNPNIKPASAEISPLEDKDRAKIDVIESKLKLKELEIDDETSGTDSGSSPGSCGSVNIGNNSGNQTGSGRVGSHDTTVIVTGDVFNTATCGR
jgi:hypothetical protein